MQRLLKQLLWMLWMLCSNFNDFQVVFFCLPAFGHSIKRLPPGRLLGSELLTISLQDNGPERSLLEKT